MRSLPSPERLRELLDYDPKTGVLTWKARDPNRWAGWNDRFAGQEAGCHNHDGYILVKIGDRKLAAHRIIWAMQYGCWPACVSHRNGKRADNRLRNLRSVSRSVAQRSQRIRRPSSSGVVGVSWNRLRQIWVAQISISGQSIYLGSFETIEEAAKARRAGERRRDRHGV